MTLHIGSSRITPLDRVYSGSDPVYNIYSGSDLIWTRYEVWQVDPLSAGDVSAWSTNGANITISRVNSDSELRIATGANFGVCTLDLHNYVASGTVCNIAFNIVSIDSGDNDIRAGLYSNANNEVGFTTEFSNSPFADTTTGIQLLAGQTIDASKRYLKFDLTSNDGINFIDVILAVA